MTAGVRHNVSFETNNIVLIALVAILYSLFKMAAVLRSHCAFVRIFAGKPGQILNNAIDLSTTLAPGLQSNIPSRAYSSYGQSPLVSKIKKEKYEFDIVKNTSEWMYVERLLPFDTIPKIKPKEQYPSGWIPPKEEAKNLPYFIARTRNSEIPIYLNVTFRGMRKISKIKKIEGDIWLLNDEVKKYLKDKNNRYVETRVHEVGRFIEVKGDFVNDLIEWAHSKGF